MDFFLLRKLCTNFEMERLSRSCKFPVKTYQKKPTNEHVGPVFFFNKVTSSTKKFDEIIVFVLFWVFILLFWSKPRKS